MLKTLADKTGHGWKTYLAGGVLFVLGGLQALGYIDPNSFEQLKTVLLGLGLVGLRHALDE